MTTNCRSRTASWAYPFSIFLRVLDDVRRVGEPVGTTHTAERLLIGWCSTSRTVVWTSHRFDTPKQSICLPEHSSVAHPAVLSDMQLPASVTAMGISSPKAGWPWVLPPRAPTDPDVRTLAHPVPLMVDSPSSYAECPDCYPGSLR